MSAVALRVPSPLEDGLEPIARRWWLSTAFGIVSVLAGVLSLARPGASLFALVLIAGVFLVVSGVVQLAAAINDELPWLVGGLGVVNLALGVVILAVPGIGLVTYAALFGIGLVARGAVAIAAGLQLRRAAARRPAGAALRGLRGAYY